MFWDLGSFQFDAVFKAAPALAETNPGLIVAITLFMLVGVAGKSAQIPLYVWLPDTMAGPTPVSALIHAATMVTAGVYLVTRSAPLYTLVPQAQYIVAMTGAVTALFAATIAVGQYDIKKVLAYSTISQLGFMVAAVGMGAYVAGMFHSSRTLSSRLYCSSRPARSFWDWNADIIIWLMAIKRSRDDSPVVGEVRRLRTPKKEHEEFFDPGDMRNMGGLRKTHACYVLALHDRYAGARGYLPVCGFWSKDEILADAFKEGFTSVYWLLTIAAFFTAFYMGRQIWMVFFGEARHEAAAHAEESPKVITVPLMVLAVLSVLGGPLNLPGFHTLTPWLEHTIDAQQASSLWGGAYLDRACFAAMLLSWLIYGRNPLKAGQPTRLKSRLVPSSRAWKINGSWTRAIWAVIVNLL